MLIRHVTLTIKIIQVYLDFIIELAIETNKLKHKTENFLFLILL